MRSLLPHLQVCSAGQRHLHADQHFVLAEFRYPDALDLQVLAAVQNRCGHHSHEISRHECVITTFNVLFVGCAASCNASPIRSVENRSETSCPKGNCRSNTIRAYSSCSVMDAL